MRLQSSSSIASFVLSLLISIEKSDSRSSSAAATGAWSNRNSQSHYQPAVVENADDLHQRRQIQEEEDDNKVCIINGDLSCTSTYYVYREFENGGVTFSEALSATGYYADLENCVLAPVYSYSDLLAISDSIPPCKAAYTAASKDPLKTYRESKSCIQEGRVPYNCDFSPLGETLGSLWGDDAHAAMDIGLCSLEDWFGDDFTDGEIWCPELKQNWFNFGSSKEEIPTDVWRAGDSSYCGDGPIQNAAAAFATDYTTGKPTAVLKAVNSGEYLSGAVYKCCQDDVVTCYNDGEEI